MSRRPRIVLYNPQAVFHTLPLALLAIGSALDRDKYDVKVVDARLNTEGLGEEIDRADVVGMSVLTGAPIRDALNWSREIKKRRPDLPVVWGGWHPSLFPRETLDEPSIDVTVRSQGEITFRELVPALLEGRDLSSVAGIGYRDAEGCATLSKPRLLVDMNELPRHDFDFIDVERYFQLKGKRQLDYVTSAGCPFRCAFCADPQVYGRKWTGLDPERVGEEAEELWRRYRFTELALQDETYFTYRPRVAEIAEQFLSRGLDFTWTATLRADQAMRLDEETFKLCVQSGFKRAMVGVESGSDEMLLKLKKDIKLEQILATAELCARHDVAAIFPFIVGFPGESDASVQASLNFVKTLRAISPQFDTPIFYFKPYPGSSLTDEVVSQGYELPSTLEAWADFDFIGSSGPWVSEQKKRQVERFKFYNRFAWGPETYFKRPLQLISRWRCQRDFYAWPFEKTLMNLFMPELRLS